MEEGICENCGSNNLVEINGIAQCQYCRTKFPDMALSKLGIDEELRDKEIRRLAKEKGEPTLGLLNDDDVLKYAPESVAASKIRVKRGESDISDRINNLKIHKSLLFKMWFFGLIGAIIIGYIVGWTIASSVLYGLTYGLHTIILIGIILLTIMICSVITYRLSK